jgi:hypothetical protein
MSSPAKAEDQCRVTDMAVALDCRVKPGNDGERD